MLLSAHSGLRYLVLLVGLVTLAYAVFGMATKRPFDPRMRVLGAAFAGTIDLTILLGLGVILSGIFRSAVGMHLVTMLLAAAVAHVVPAVMKRRPPEERSWAPYATGTAIALALIALGITLLGRPIVG